MIGRRRLAADRAAIIEVLAELLLDDLELEERRDRETAAREDTDAAGAHDPRRRLAQ